MCNPLPNSQLRDVKQLDEDSDLEQFECRAGCDDELIGAKRGSSNKKR
jgi:hypothetical protein